MYRYSTPVSASRVSSSLGVPLVLLSKVSAAAPLGGAPARTAGRRPLDAVRAQWRVAFISPCDCRLSRRRERDGAGSGSQGAGGAGGRSSLKWPLLSRARRCNGRPERPLPAYCPLGLGTQKVGKGLKGWQLFLGSWHCNAARGRARGLGPRGVVRSWPWSWLVALLVAWSCARVLGECVCVNFKTGRHRTAALKRARPRGGAPT